MRLDGIRQALDKRVTSLPFVVSVVVFATYTGAARFVGSFYPVSTFDMYAHHAPPSVTELTVVDEAGTAARLTSYHGFHCQEPVAPFEDAIRQCESDAQTIPYRIRNAQAHFDASRSVSPGPEHIRIVARTYDLTDPTDGPPPFVDCVLVECTAERRR